MTARHDFARLLLGSLATGPSAFPPEFAPAGQVELGGETADVLTVTGPDGFAGRLLVDVSTRLPLLFTWMDREPLIVPPARTQTTFSDTLTSEQAAELRCEREERIRQAEATRRVVEYRFERR